MERLDADQKVYDASSQVIPPSCQEKDTLLILISSMRSKNYKYTLEILLSIFLDFSKASGTIRI